MGYNPLFKRFISIQRELLNRQLCTYELNPRYESLDGELIAIIADILSHAS